MADNSDKPLASFLKTGAVSLAGKPEQISTSFSKKSLPGGDSEPLAISFHNHKGEGGAGDLRLKGYEASQVMAKY